MDGQIGKEGAARDEEQDQVHRQGVDGRRVDALHAGDEEVLIGIRARNQGKRQDIGNPVGYEQLLIRQEAELQPAELKDSHEEDDFYEENDQVTAPHAGPLRLL